MGRLRFNDGFVSERTRLSICQGRVKPVRKQVLDGAGHSKAGLAYAEFIREGTLTWGILFAPVVGNIHTTRKPNLRMVADMIKEAFQRARPPRTPG